MSKIRKKYQPKKALEKTPDIFSGRTYSRENISPGDDRWLQILELIKLAHANHLGIKLEEIDPPSIRLLEAVDKAFRTYLRDQASENVQTKYVHFTKQLAGLCEWHRRRHLDDSNLSKSIARLIAECAIENATVDDFFPRGSWGLRGGHKPKEFAKKKVAEFLGMSTKQVGERMVKRQKERLAARLKSPLGNNFNYAYLKVAFERWSQHIVPPSPGPSWTPMKFIFELKQPPFSPENFGKYPEAFLLKKESDESASG